MRVNKNNINKIGVLGRTVALMFALLLTPLATHADQDDFFIRHVEINNVDGVFRLDADVQYALGEPVKEALLNGVKLVFELEIRLWRVRAWMPDKEVANLKQRFRLVYHALSQQYLVDNINTGVQETFPDLPSALRALGEIVNLPVIDASLLESKRRYVSKIRARLAIDELPLPLRLRSYVSPAWWLADLATDWHTLKLP